MKRKLVKFISVAFVCTLVACTNEESLKDLEVKDQSESSVNLCGVNVETKNGTLVFETEEQMKELSLQLSGVSTPVYLMKSVSSFTNMTQINALREAGFRSMYDVFVEAMNEAESYYDREGGYEEFKEKYSSLYFPEEGDDYSAYLPISDKELAKIADKNGNVIVGGKTISLIDINSYKELEDLGLTPPSENNLRATSGTNSIAEEEVGKNKVWVKCKNTSDKGIPIIQVEVCFRKKNFVGIWYNHNSGTSAKLGAGFGVAEYGGTMLECFGFSSHDYKYARASNGIDKLPVARTVIIRHNGTGRTLTLKLDYPQELL
ncbi:DUF4848 domain-containing protein [uncultured Parabacteroides sp.]|jgi:hypothetical protein|uniref:DUF4848 domain-containing protein n=1 Tax=uncultured Parabacteroides sp. TaxID=512312 RepID=UPI0025D9744C|nr:DUF4848 domain-containing protein [uncultured Parabacteroides sp.]